MSPIRRTKKYLRVKTTKLKVKPTKFRYHDIGKKGHTQRIAAYHPKKGWRTYGWIFSLEDIKNKRPTTMKLLKKLKIKLKR